jgi:hypothetical protein
MLYDHAVVEQSYEEDSLALTLDTLNKEIDDATKFSGILDGDLDDLRDEVRQLHDLADGKIHDNQTLQEEFDRYPIPADTAYGTGDFFHRLSAWELREARSQGLLAGFKAQIKIENDEIRTGERTNANLTQQLHQLQSQLPDGTSSDKGRTGGLRRLNAQLADIENRIATVRNNCEHLRHAIRDKTARLRTIPTDAIAQLTSEKVAIEQDVRAKREELKAIIIQQKEMEERDSRSIRKTQKSVEELEGDDVWESERALLHRQIAQATADLERLHAAPSSVRSPGSITGSVKRRGGDSRSVTSKRTATSVSRESKVELTESTLRLAMQAELAALSAEDHPINVSLRSEESYRAFLEEEIAKARRLGEAITQFKDETFGPDGSDDFELRDQQMRGQRLAALGREYEELREELRIVSGIN